MKPSLTRFADLASATIIIVLPAIVAFGVCVLLVETASGAVTAADVAGTFDASCAGCHGADGSSSTPMGKSVAAPDLRSPVVQQEPDTKLTDVIANGTTRMPGFKSSLTDDQIHGLVLHIRELAKGK